MLQAAIETSGNVRKPADRVEDSRSQAVNMGKINAMNN
jgi:hypothetical protein